jgi:putative membrane protein
MKKVFSGLMIATAALAFQACNSSSTSNDSKAVADSANETKDTSTNATTTGGIAVDSDDSKFAVEAANGGMAEVELAKLAETKATNAKVKEFAAMMIKDHTKANEELMALAKTKNITLPTTPGADQQKVMDDLSKKSGADFDKGYVDAMVTDHDKDVSLFEKASSDCKDAELKSFAVKTLPVLKMHQESIKNIQNGMK